MEIKLKRLHPNAIIPGYKTPGSAAVDLHYCGSDPIEICSGECVLIPTGIAISMPKGTAALVLPRSGASFRTVHDTAYPALKVANSPGLIDSDYRGEVKVILENASPRGSGFRVTISPGQRIAQLMFVPIFCVSFHEVDVLDETERGEGGFGSTGA